MLCLSGFELYSRWVPLLLKLLNVKEYTEENGSAALNNLKRV